MTNPSSENGRNWTLLAAGVFLPVAGWSIGYFQKQGASEVTVSNLSIQIDAMERRLSKDIERVDMNSAARRVEIREEMIQRDTQQQREIDLLRKEMESDER